MTRFHFYHIHNKYIRFLQSGENKVLYNKGQRRPYVGIVLKISGMDYFVPLESPKANHANIKSSSPVLKLDGGKLGIMGFNNMIPVPKSALIDFDFDDVYDEKYRLLLVNQLNYCNNNRKLILNRASTTYRKATSGNNPFYEKICCDFKKLERMCRSYNPKFKAKKKP